MRVGCINEFRIQSSYRAKPGKHSTQDRPPALPPPPGSQTFFPELPSGRGPKGAIGGRGTHNQGGREAEKLPQHLSWNSGATIPGTPGPQYRIIATQQEFRDASAERPQNRRRVSPRRQGPCHHWAVYHRSLWIGKRGWGKREGSRVPSPMPRPRIPGHEFRGHNTELLSCGKNSVMHQRNIPKMTLRLTAPPRALPPLGSISPQFVDRQAGLGKARGKPGAKCDASRRHGTASGSRERRHPIQCGGVSMPTQAWAWARHSRIPGPQYRIIVMRQEFRDASAERPQNDVASHCAAKGPAATGQYITAVCGSASGAGKSEREAGCQVRCLASAWDCEWFPRSPPPDPRRRDQHAHASVGVGRALGRRCYVGQVYNLS